MMVGLNYLHSWAMNFWWDEILLPFSLAYTYVHPCQLYLHYKFCPFRMQIIMVKVSLKIFNSSKINNLKLAKVNIFSKKVIAMWSSWLHVYIVYSSNAVLRVACHMKNVKSWALWAEGNSERTDGQSVGQLNLQSCTKYIHHIILYPLPAHL